MSSLSLKGQALVRAGRRAYQPNAVDRERLLTQLRSRLGDAALPVTTSASTLSAVASGSSAWPLITLVVVGVGVLGGGLFYAWPRGADQNHLPEPRVAPVATTPRVIQPATQPIAAQGIAETAPTESEVATPSTAAAAHPTNPLAAEVAILARATRELRAGRAADALKALDEYRRRFPQGLLRIEHRAARAQALCALGRFDEANAKLAGLPKQSPLAVRARQFCDARWARR
jgi:hypothetical protein